MNILPPLPRNRTILALVAGFFAIGFLIYAWSLANQFVRWDDGMLIYENPAIRQITPASIKWIFTHFDPELYIPVTFFTYQLDYLIAGVHPFQYHLDNLVLHILNSLLVMFLAFALLKRQWMALFCGLLFLVHPLNTEGVEWASGRKDVLSTFFFLASIGSYLFYRDRSSRVWFIASLLLFTLGLLSKVMIVSLPVVLILIDWMQSRRFNRQMILDTLPYALLSLLFGVVGLLGKQGVIASSTPEDKFLMAFKSTAFYVHQFFLPTRLSLLYPYTQTIRLFSPDILLSILAVCVLLGIIAFTWNRIRGVAVGLLFFLVTVVPTLFNFSKGAEMDIYFASDRYAYVPQIGLIIAVASLLVYVYDQINESSHRPVIVGSVSAGTLVLLVFSILAYKQTLVWHDTRTLFQNVIAKYPDASYVAYNNLCNADRLADDPTQAILDCQKSLAVRPSAKTYSNLGAVYRKQKDYSDALAVYQKGIALDPTSPYPLFGIGIVYAEQGNYTQAETDYLKAIALMPTYTDVYVNLGALYAAEGKYTQAVEQYQKALAIDPFTSAALYNLAVAEGALGKSTDAMKDYARAISVEPTLIAARINLALLLHSNGQDDAAIAQFRAVLQIDPHNATAHSALQQLGQE
jgi:tetratricopeptide (TPR) repeat protein